MSECGLIIEGIVTTLDEQGRVNIAPMGPRVSPDGHSLVLRPFRTATTYRNLKTHGEGVFHVTDDVLLLAQAAVGQLPDLPPMRPAEQVRGMILTDACRWQAFRVTALNDAEERTRIEAKIVDSGRLRDFVGFNRAKHAVVEAAILATRVNILPPDEIQSQLNPLRSMVDKTGGEQERQAFAFLHQYLQQSLGLP
jgi:hypothetical protein